MNTTSLILKQDGQGRVHTPAERREELLAEFARSGLSATRFAALAGIRYQTFISWVRKQRRAAGAAPSPSVRGAHAFVEAVVAAPSQPLVIELAAGIRLQLHHAGQVPLACKLLHTLARPC